MHEWGTRSDFSIGAAAPLDPIEMCAVVGDFTSDASGNMMCIDTLK